MDSNKEIVKIQQALSAGKSFEESGLPDSMRSRWDEIDKEYKWFKANDLQMEVVNEWSDWSSETLEGLMTPWTKEALAELERDDDEEEDEEQGAKQLLSLTLLSNADSEHGGDSHTRGLTTCLLVSPA